MTLPEGETARIVRRSARTIVIDDDGRLVLIKRTVPGRAPYWTTPGGGVEPEDLSIEAAARRELFEELGATADGYTRVFLTTTPLRRDDGFTVSYFFLCRLTSMDLEARNGPEISDPTRGRYDPDRIDLRTDQLSAIDLRPAELRHFILANRMALLAEVGPALPLGPGGWVSGRGRGPGPPEDDPA